MFLELKNQKWNEVFTVPSKAVKESIMLKSGIASEYYYCEINIRLVNFKYEVYFYGKLTRYFDLYKSNYFISTSNLDEIKLSIDSFIDKMSELEVFA
jgi:hypothetical protein